MRENRETRKAPQADGGGGRSGKAAPKPDMHADRESDVSIVPAKRANKVGTPMAESVEEREAPKGNAGSGNLTRTGHRAGHMRGIGGASVRQVKDSLPVILS